MVGGSNRRKNPTILLLPALIKKGENVKFKDMDIDRTHCDCGRKLQWYAGLIEGRKYCPMVSWEDGHFDIMINNLGTGKALYQVLEEAKRTT